MFKLKPYFFYETVAIVVVPNITFSWNFKSAFLLVLLTNDYFEVLLLCLLFWRKKRDKKQKKNKKKLCLFSTFGNNGYFLTLAKGENEELVNLTTRHVPTFVVLNCYQILLLCIPNRCVVVGQMYGCFVKKAAGWTRCV